MHDVRRIDLMENIYDENERIADEIKSLLSERKILCVNLMGSPGAGKTSAIKALVSRLSESGIKSYVIEGDIESDIDTKALKELGIESVQINTFGSCHLDAPMIKAMLDNTDFTGPAVLFIENIGNLVCPAEFTIGEHILLLISSVAEGSDKPYKYPLAYEKADILILNKADLLPYIEFDEEFFMRGFRSLNKSAAFFKTSIKSGEGFNEAADFIAYKAVFK